MVTLSRAKELRSPNQQTPKITMTTLLCRYTAVTRRKKRRDIAGTQTTLKMAEICETV
jgi:hypothetical protein